ncbi:hypothetical protein DFH11DRAFT_1755228 [Phellopilus nigrolimitatus]|nr:hypothetical protein DFH11DRAFT_1755228 [Phellopilus nigrolimitatus]
MSSQNREPMWYCHECNAEMRPLMMPDPHCASCRGSFVEKIENLDDDPREFHDAAAADMEGDLGPFGIFAAFNEILRATSPSGPHDQRTNTSSPTRDRSASPLQGTALRFEFGRPNNRRTVVLGGHNPTNRRDSGTGGNTTSPGSEPPRLSEFLRANNESDGSNAQDSIPGQLMAQYLLTLMSGSPLGMRGTLPFMGAMGTDNERGVGQGRWGDYVFTQEALDQLMTQMMEGANSTRPVPATEEIIEKLPREVLEEGSHLLEKDCAVCKEQFNAKSEDPDEQVVVTLPCKHPFHEGCILPWLKSNGTCPVCRYALVPQPNARPTEPGSSSDARPSSSGHDSSSGSGEGAVGGSSSNNVASGSHSGFFSTLFGNHSRSGSNASNRSGGSRSSHSMSPSRDRRRDPRGGAGESDDVSHIPGGWGYSID